MHVQSRICKGVVCVYVIAKPYENEYVMDTKEWSGSAYGTKYSLHPFTFHIELDSWYIYRSQLIMNFLEADSHVKVLDWYGVNLHALLCGVPAPTNLVLAPSFFTIYCKLCLQLLSFSYPKAQGLSLICTFVFLFIGTVQSRAFFYKARDDRVRTSKALSTGWIMSIRIKCCV